MATPIRKTEPSVILWATAHNDLKAQIGAGANFHLDKSEKIVTSANAADLATSLTLVNEMIGVYKLSRGV